MLHMLRQAYQSLTNQRQNGQKKIFPDPDNIHTVLVPPFVIL